MERELEEKGKKGEVKENESSEFYMMVGGHFICGWSVGPGVLGSCHEIHFVVSLLSDFDVRLSSLLNGIFLFLLLKSPHLLMLSLSLSLSRLN